MSMSVDGYIAGPNDEPGNPGGDRFERLHEWFVSRDGEFFRPSGPAGELIDEINATGAVLAVGAPWSRPTTGKAITTVSRSSCPVTGRQARPSRTIRW
jgi:hypothetical protein